MKLESRIHCGHVISCRTTERATLIETRHDAGSRLATHAHSSPHLAILLSGAYFERIGDECFLRLPGDRVFYPQFFEHENRFGRLPATCLNVETSDGSEPVLPTQSRTNSEAAKFVHDLVFCGKADSLASAAKKAGYHPVYLSRLFRKAYGMSLGEFVKNCRLRKSAALIFRSDLALSDIALESGYYDQSHLTNELNATTGFTPGELRRLAN
jgi:AraC-like DNA-binding protein